MRLAGPLVALVALLLPVASAHGAAYLPPDGKVWSGVTSGRTVEAFPRPAVVQSFVQWDGTLEWAFRRAEAVPARAMLHVSTAAAQERPGRISPGAIAAGHGDAFLLALGRRLDEHGGPVYVRLLAEMNNCHNAYSPMDCRGRSRGRSHGSRRFVAAWRRAALVLRGGDVARIDRRLRRLELPPVRTDARTLPRPRVALVWAPMTGGSPMVASLAPARFWPGRAYVDWVGTSFYSRFPNFGWLESFYRRWATGERRPFALAEWAMWGSDDPGFARRLMSWVRTHPRVRMVQYNQGENPAGPFRLERHPRAARVIRGALAGPLFSARPPELRP